MFSFLTAPKLLITALIAGVFTVAVIQSNVNQTNLMYVSGDFSSFGLGAGGEFGSKCGTECAGKTGPALQVCLGNCQRGVFCESRFGGGGGYGDYGPPGEYGANSGETGFSGGGDGKTRELCIMHCMESTNVGRDVCSSRCSFGEEFMSCEEEVCNEVYNPNLEEWEQMEHINNRIQDICYRDSGAEADSGGENFDSGGDVSEEGTFGVDSDEDGSGEMGDNEGGFCGDEVCDSEEDADSCPEDCGPPPDECGDGICGLNEDDDTCPQDCRGAADECGNGVCDLEEDEDICPEDCQSAVGECGDDVCDLEEDEFSCPEDCSSDGGLGDQNTDFENVDQGDEWGDGAEADTGEVGLGDSVGGIGEEGGKCKEVTQSSSCCEKCEYLACKGKMTFDTCIVQHCGGIQDDCSGADQGDDTGADLGNEEPFCGDGMCDEDIGEDQDFCPEDCGFGDDDLGTDGEGVCGDDVCDFPNENVRTCYEDCAESYQACVNQAGQYPPNEEDPATYYCGGCLQDLCYDKDAADALAECQERGMCTGSSDGGGGEEFQACVQEAPEPTGICVDCYQHFCRVPGANVALRCHNYCGGGNVDQGNQCGDLTSDSSCEETCHFIACREGTDIQECLDENCPGDTGNVGVDSNANGDACNFNQECEIQEMGTACADCVASNGSCNYNQKCELYERGTDCVDCAGLGEDTCNYDQTCDPTERGTDCFDCFLDGETCNFDDICDSEEIGTACVDCATSDDDGELFGDLWGDDATGDVCNHDSVCDLEEIGMDCFDCLQGGVDPCNNDQICDAPEIGTSCLDCFGEDIIEGTVGDIAGDAGEFWGAGGTEGEFDLVPPDDAPFESAGVQAVSEAVGTVFQNITSGIGNFFRGLFGG